MATWCTVILVMFRDGVTVFDRLLVEGIIISLNISVVGYFCVSDTEVKVILQNKLYVYNCHN